jgi:hypothetical protein
MSQINQQNLINIFKNIDIVGHRFIFIELETSPSLNKKNRVTGLNLMESLQTNQIIKMSEGVFSIGLIYENAVNNNLERAEYETNFETSELPWGHFVEDSKIIIKHQSKNDTSEKYYIRLYQYKNKPVRKSKFYKIVDDVRIELTEEELLVLKGFLPVEKQDTKLEDGSFDTVKPIVNTVKIESIVRVKFDSEEYFA